jgi:hypothetical protein
LTSLSFGLSLLHTCGCRDAPTVRVPQGTIDLLEIWESVVGPSEEDDGNDITREKVGKHVAAYRHTPLLPAS